MKLEKVGLVEAISLILIIRICHLITNVPKAILTSTGSASLLNTIYVSCIVFALVGIIYVLFKRFGSHDLLDISEFLGGKWLKYIVGFLYISYFIFTSSLVLRSFSESLKLIYFPRTKVALIIFVFLLGVIVLNKLGKKSVIKTNLMVVPLIIISIIVIFFMSSKNFTIQRALPILGHGFKETFIFGISNIFAFSGISILFFLKPMLKNTKDFKKLCFITISISSILLLIIVSCLLLLFPFITSSEEVLSIYIASRQLEFGSIIQRADAIFILFWILSILSYLSVVMLFCLKVFKKTTNTTASSPMIYCFASILFGVALLEKNISQIRFLENHVFKWACIIIVFILSISILYLANLKKKKLENSSKKEGEVVS